MGIASKGSFSKNKMSDGPAAMAYQADRLRPVRRQLRLRVDRLVDLSRRANKAVLVEEVDQIRRIAQAYDMPCVIDLAHQLESMIAGGWSATLASHYFAALQDAVSGDAMDAQGHQAVLASVAVYGVR